MDEQRLRDAKIFYQEANVMGAAAVPVLAATAVLGAVHQGQLARQAGRQANATAKYNAAVGEQEAVAAEDKAAVDESIHRDRVKSAVATLKARIGKSGVTSPAQAKAIEASIEAGKEILKVSQGKYSGTYGCLVWTMSWRGSRGGRCWSSRGSSIGRRTNQRRS